MRRQTCFGDITPGLFRVDHFLATLLRHTALVQRGRQPAGGLDKSESRTDWLARPLTERQLEYAAADVFYLLPIAAPGLFRVDHFLATLLRHTALVQRGRQPAGGFRLFSESRTDWLARPLTERQLEYAAADVFYLLPIAGQQLTRAKLPGVGDITPGLFRVDHFLATLLRHTALVQRWSTRKRPGVISPTPGSFARVSWPACSC
jgi:hypothetical protein